MPSTNPAGDPSAAPAPSPAETRLIERLRRREAKVGVFGLGYVGLPLSLRFSAVGIPVIGFDIDARKVDMLNAGRSYIELVPAEAIAAARGRGFEASADMARAAEVDALIICVPTPLNRNREPDLSFVTSTVDAICPYLRAGQIMSLESTTYPGTTEEELRPRIERAGLVVGEDVFLVFSPEREDPGNTAFNTQTIPKICGGTTPACRRVGVALYELAVDKVIPMSSTQAAEMTKLLENIHRAVNIGLVNEMKIVADRMGIDIYEVIRAAATKPFGFVPYFPGPGLGGHCIPIDPFYLTWKAREFGVHTRFIELAGEINSAMPAWVVGKIGEALNARSRSVKGSRLLILGIAYKRNVDDMRESPAMEIIEALVRLGAQVDYSDPHVPRVPPMRRHAVDMQSVALDPGVVAGYDAVVLVTDHLRFDYAMIEQSAAAIVDTRGVFGNATGKVTRA